MSQARIFGTLGQGQLPRTLRVVLPCLIDCRVFGAPLGHDRSPIGEHLLLLRRATLIAGRSESVWNRRGNGICFGVCRVGDRQAYASEVVILVVVGISTAVLLLQIDIENRSLGVFHRMV